MKAGFPRRRPCLVLDLDGSLPGQPGLRARIDANEATRIDARDLAPRLRIHGSRSVLGQLRDRVEAAFPIAAVAPPTIFYGSGDFHHLALVFLAAQREPFTLLHIDNHPDWTRFPATVNCGGWISRALTLPLVEHIVTVGPSGDDFIRPQWKFANLAAIRHGRLEVHPFRAPPSRLWGRAIQAPGCRTEAGRLIWDELAMQSWDNFSRSLDGRLPQAPIWVSFDKDALSHEEAVTNWNQGGLRLEDVLALVGRLCRRRPFLGMDVCGDYSAPVFGDPFRAFLSATDRPAMAAPDPARARAVNDAANRRILAAAQGWAA